MDVGYLKSQFEENREFIRFKSGTDSITNLELIQKKFGIHLKKIWGHSMKTWNPWEENMGIFEESLD